MKIKLTFLLLVALIVGGYSYPVSVSADCINGRSTETGKACIVITPLPAGAGGTQNGSVAPQNKGTNLGYTPLEPIVGVTTGPNGQLNFTDLLGNIYRIAISIGALFSVLMLTLSGVRYMLSDVVTDKDRAKKRITACLYGLVLIAASWLILNTINPQLVRFTLNPGSATINPSPTVGQSTATTNVSTNTDSTTYSALRAASGCSTGCYQSTDYLVYNPSDPDTDKLNKFKENCEGNPITSKIFGWQVKQVSGSVINAPEQTALVCRSY